MVVLASTFDEFKEVIKNEVKLALESPQIEKIQEQYFTRKETAKILRITLPTLRSYSLKGKIKAYRFGSRVRYKKSEIDEAMKAFSV